MSKTQKILAGALGLATVLSLVGTAAVFTASAQTGYNFTANLTVGSSGPQVTALQQLLASKGFFSATPTGYFGSVTKAAVATWQSSVGLPSTGYFGPLSRAAVNSMAMTTTPGCSAGAMFNSMTGAPCSTSMSTVPGCTAGAMFSSTTGASCSGSTTTTTTTTTTGTAASCPAGYTCTIAGQTSSGSAQEGSLNLTLAGTPSNQTNIQTDINVPVWGLQAQAQIGDVTIQRLDLDINDTVQATNQYQENPGNFINAIQVSDASTGSVLGTWPVNVNSFVQGTSSSDYYIRLSGFNFVIPNGSTKTLVVSVSTNGGIDTARNLTITGYGSTGLQTSSLGIVDYYNISGTNFSRTQQFTKPGNTTVTFGVDASNPLSSSFYADPNQGAQNTPVFAFNVQATNANANINSVTITPTVNSKTGDAQTASTITLVSNGVTVASQSLNGTTAVTFNNIQNFVIPSGTTQTVVVEVNVPAFATTNNGVGTSTVQLTLSSVTYQSTTGQIYTATPSIAGNKQYFFEATPQLSVSGISEQTPTVNNNQNGKTIAISDSLIFTATPKGGQMVQPQASDFVVSVGSSRSTATAIPTASTTINITPVPSSSTAPLSQGQAYTIQLSTTANGLAGGGNPLVSGTGNYQFYLTSASTTVTDPNGGPVSSVQTWGLDNFKSPTVGVAE
jgi:hypothetical protein